VRSGERRVRCAFPRSVQSTCAVLTVLLLLAAGQVHAELHVVVIGGLGGEPAYEREIDAAVEDVVEALEATVGARNHIVRLVGESATRSAIEAELASLRARMDAKDRVVVCLLGHGSWDGEVYKLNLRGPDLSAELLAEWLARLPAERQLIVNATASSGGSLEALAAPRRILMTATRSGSERNATVFGKVWSEALSTPEADMDRDGWITAREAFDWTRKKVEAHYEAARLLETEHAQLLGDAPQEFRIVRLTGAAIAPAAVGEADRRRELRRAIAELRARKAELSETEYYRALEALLVPLAELLLDADRSGRMRVPEASDARGEGTTR